VVSDTRSRDQITINDQHSVRPFILAHLRGTGRHRRRGPHRRTLLIVPRWNWAADR
jgi:hypothetical protein